MDFKMTVPEEWLSRRRNQVAEASRRIRAKKKKEEEELRIENEKLLKERTNLLQKISDLEGRICTMREPNEDLENELLRAMLEQHKGFLKGFFEQISVLEPSEISSKGELAKQNRDFLLMHSLRLISESQQNVGNTWKPVIMPPGVPSFGRGEVTLCYCRNPITNVLSIRSDMVLPKTNAQKLRDLMIRPWTDMESFQEIFCEGIQAIELPEFSVITEEEQLKGIHLREIANESKYRDVVFLSAIGKTVLGKSTLQLEPGRGPVMSQLLNLQEVESSPSISSSSSKKKSKLSDPIDWGICGTAEVFYGLRSVTEHGNVGDSDTLERELSTGIECGFAWSEEIESADVEIAGPCARELHLLTIPPDFRFQAIGRQEDFIDIQGNVGPKLLLVLARYIQRALESAV